VDPLNKLPLSVVDSESIGVFKRQIDKFMDTRNKDIKSFIAYNKFIRNDDDDDDTKRI
jgi:hypothetical protein